MGGGGRGVVGRLLDNFILDENSMHMVIPLARGTDKVNEGI